MAEQHISRKQTKSADSVLWLGGALLGAGIIMLIVVGPVVLSEAWVFAPLPSLTKFVGITAYLIPLFMILFGLVTLLIWVALAASDEAKEAERLGKLMLQTIPDLQEDTFNPTALNNQHVLRVAMLVGIYLALYIGIFFAFQQAFHAIAQPLAMMLAFSISLSDFLQERFTEEHEIPLSKHVQQAVINTIRKLVIAGACVAVLYGAWLIASTLPVEQEFIDEPVMFSLALILMILVFPLPHALPLVAAHRALHSGDYDEALRHALKSPNVWSLKLQAVILNYVGRWHEAERVGRKCLISMQKLFRAHLQISGLLDYGQTMLGMGNYEQARRIFELVIREKPTHSDAYCWLAETHLRQGIAPREALSLIDKALDKTRFGALDQLFAPWSAAHYLSVKAWALAALKQHDQAAVVLQQAFEKAVPKFEPEMAFLHYRAAQVAALRGDTNIANSHLELTIALDPRGAAGQLARSQRE